MTTNDGRVRGPDTVAAIDLGTNTALLLVARARADGGLDTIEEVCLTPRLGAGLAATGALEEQAVERALAALRSFAATIRAHGVPNARVRAVGTACLRRARDGRAFAERAARETGIAIEILSEDEEARLGELAVACAGAGPETLVVDVGGGSTEIACRAVGLRRSIPVGAVVLTETWLDPLVPDARRWAACAPRSSTPRAHSRPARPGSAGVGDRRHRGPPRGVRRGARALRSARRRGVARRQRARGRVGGPAGRPDAGRAPRVPRSRAERADILPAGLAVLAAVLDRIGAREVRVSGFGLRHGIARELLGA